MIAKLRLDATNDLSKVRDWINQVYAQACIETEAVVSTATMSLTAGTASYTLPTQVVRIKAMYVTPVGGAQSQPMLQTTLDYILRRRQASGGVGAALGYVTHYAVLGSTDIEVYPTPQSADTITIYYVGLPTALSGNTDLPSALQEPYASKVLEYGALAEGGDFKGDPMTDEYRAMFQLWLSKLKTQITRKAGSQPGQFRVFPDHMFPPHDPSTDTRYWG